MTIIKIWDKYGIYILTALIFALLFIIIGPRFVTLVNLANVMLQVSIVSVAGVSMVFAITSGGFDLSIGAIQTLTTVVVTMALKFWGLDIITSIVISLLIGALFGLMNGVIITKLKVQTFVATLATMLIIRGAAFLLNGGRDVVINGRLDYKMLTSFRILGFSVMVWVTLAIVICGYILYTFTRFGVFVRAIGSNETASRTSGIPVDRTLILVFIFSGITAALTGIILSSQLLDGNANFGTTFAMEVITVTILGGTALAGGKGNVPGMFCAAILLGFISNGLNILNVPFYFQYLTTGIVLIFALLMNNLRYFVKVKAEKGETR